MQFDHPGVLALLVLLIPGAIGLARAERARQHALDALVAEPIRDTVLRGHVRPRLRSALLLLGVGFIIVASAGPRSIARSSSVPPSDRDVLILVDVSHSMAAEDVQPSRLEYAQEAIRTLLAHMTGERVAIIAFAGSAFLQCPLTRDYGAVRMLADGLTPGVLPRQGTALREAFAHAAAMLAKNRERAGYVLVMTDGEDHAEDPRRAAARLKNLGAQVFVFGIGHDAGAPIPLRDTAGSLTGYKRDDSGGLVLTRPNWALLEELAAASGGRAYRSGQSNEFAELTEELSRDASTLSPRSTRVAETLAVILAFACVVGEGWIDALARLWPGGHQLLSKSRFRSAGMRPSYSGSRTIDGT